MLHVVFGYLAQQLRILSHERANPRFTVVLDAHTRSRLALLGLLSLLPPTRCDSATAVTLDRLSW